MSPPLAWVVVSLALLCPTLGAAQSAESVLAPLVPKSKLVRFSVGSTYMTGRLIALSSGVATLGTETGNQTATLASVDAIWVRGNEAKTGAIIGGITVGVLGGLFSAAVAAGVCEVDCPTPFAAGVVGGVVFGAAGGLLGAGIGALIPKWRLRFP